MATLKNTTVAGTGAITLPVGTTAQRPGTPQAGDMRFNESFDTVEYYDGSLWRYQPDIVRAGLVLHLDAGEPASYSGTGTTWSDLTSNNNSVSLGGSATYSSNSGGYLDFSSTVSSASNNILSYLGVTTGADNDVPYSMEAIIYLDSAPTGTATSGMSILGHASAGGIGLQVFEDSGIKINFGYRANNNYYSTSTLSLSAWYHVLCTRGIGGTSAPINFYINGILDSSFFGDNRIDYTTASLQIGSAETRVGRFDGRIPYIAVYNRALSSSEVYQNFQALRGRYGI